MNGNNRKFSSLEEWESWGIEELRSDHAQLVARLADATTISNDLASGITRAANHHGGDEMTELEYSQQRLAEVERSEAYWKERAEGYWSCIQEEMAENHQLFIKLGIIPHVEKAEQPSIKLVNDAIDALQREVRELKDKVEYQAGYIDECKAEITDYVREITRLKEALEPLSGLMVTAEQIERALERLGPTRDRDEAYVKAATQTLIRIMQALAARTGEEGAGWITTHYGPSRLIAAANDAYRHIAAWCDEQVSP